MSYVIEFERENDGRWIAEISSLPGVMAYGVTRIDAELRVRLIARQVLAVMSQG